MIICLMPAVTGAVYADTNATPAAPDNAVNIYADYGSGFEFLTALYFPDGVEERSVIVDRPVKALRVVRGACYDLNLDRLTLGGVCPEGYERKLSATDNDLIEVEDSLDFKISGSGELVIAARAPVDVKGEAYSFKFPTRNLGPIMPDSYFYSYVPGTVSGSFEEGEAVTVPDEAALFVSEMCHPASGHPDAPMDIYVADDGETLYVFFDAFLDNTFDHGKDFAAVHVKSGGEVRTYKVHTTPENVYGAWWFDYTDSSDVYDWEHMCYLVEVPMADLETEGGTLSLAFEYYGTAYMGEELGRLGIGTVYLVSEDESQYYDMESGDIGLLPAVGEILNSSGGNTAEGEWWLQGEYVGYSEYPRYTLTLNGVSLKEKSRYAYCPLYTYGSLTIELAEGTVNTVEYYDPENGYGYAIEAEGQELVIQGAGTLNAKSDYLALACVSYLTIQDGAEVNAVVEGTCQGDTWGSNYYYTALEAYSGLTVDNAKVNARAVVTAAEGITNLIEVRAILAYNGCAVQNDASLEGYAAGGTAASEDYCGGNYALESRYEMNTSGLEITIKEGETKDSAVEVDELTDVSANEYRFYTMPYVFVEVRGRNYPLYVAGRQVTSLNADDLSVIPGVEGEASFDPETNTLYLNGAEITAPGDLGTDDYEGYTGIHYIGGSPGLFIVADGKNSVTVPYNPAEDTGLGGSSSFGINAQGRFLSIKLNEGAELSVKGGDVKTGQTYGIYAEQALVTGPGTLRAEGGKAEEGSSTGLHAYGRLALSNVDTGGSAIVIIEPDDPALSAPGPVIEALGGEAPYSYGIEETLSAGNLHIVGSKVTAAASGSEWSAGIHANGTFNIINSDAYIDAGTGGTSCYGMDIDEYHNVVIYNSKVTAVGGTMALEYAPTLMPVESEEVVAGGSVNADGTDAEVYDAEKNDTYKWFRVPFAFDITFVDEDGTVLQSGPVDFGKMPEYTGETPTKPADDKYTYTFSGWTPELVPVTFDATYTATYTAEEIPEPQPENEIIRLAGPNRYDTALAAAEHLREKSATGKFKDVIIASGKDFPDALSATYLAYVKGAPILLVGNADSITKVTKYINENQVEGGTVYIVGGTGAVPAEVDGKLTGKVVRLAGANRYATNIEVLKEAGIGENEILIASGKGYADALSASAAGRPILLVGNALTADQKAYLEDNKANLGGKTYIVGGTGAVSDAVEKDLKNYFTGDMVRFAGKNRYETSEMVAKAFFTGEVDTMVIASGKAFPDGLSGGPVATTYGAPLLLVTDGVVDHAKSIFTDKGMYRLMVMGGTGAVSKAIAEDIAAPAKEAE